MRISHLALPAILSACGMAASSASEVMKKVEVRICEGYKKANEHVVDFT